MTNQQKPSKLSSLYINCTLKKSPARSHTEGLINTSIEIMEQQGVVTNLIRAVDLNIQPSVDPDFTDDDWQDLYEKIKSSDILVIGTPIWLGEKSSVAVKIMERLYAHSAETNEAGQYIYYNKVGGVLITGNEDGGKHVARDVLYGLSHIGFTIPPQADSYWVGEAGPGPSYLDAGQQNEFTIRNTSIMTWNLIHLASQFKLNPIPAKGNVVQD
ncbi:MAG: flavodoxin [Cyclobacteriaceae bacterium]|nr:MAG: flavodoxin [Cyclobacteriaceae bacterium]